MGLMPDRCAASRPLMRRLFPCAIAGTVVLAFAPASSAAQASSFRQLAPSVARFVSDGERYVAWQVSGGAPVVILDTRSARQSANAAIWLSLARRSVSERSGDLRDRVARGGRPLPRVMPQPAVAVAGGGDRSAHSASVQHRLEVRRPAICRR